MGLTLQYINPIVIEVLQYQYKGWKSKKDGLNIAVYKSH